MHSERPPFNDSSEQVIISAEDKIIGARTNELFTTRLIRPLPWDIKDGRISVTREFTQEAQVRENVPGIEYVPGLYMKEIVTEGLSNEDISPEVARVIGLFKMVEDFLPDYMARGTKEGRNVMGINRSYLQWGREELQHSLAAGLILEQTGHKSADELTEEYQQNLERTWEAPFPTLRQMVIYGFFQERHTNIAYNALAKRAKEEGAPITAEVLRLIGKDEAYHSAGYREFVKIFHEVDPEGTKADVLHVTRNYRMPALNLYLNPRQAFKDLVRVGAYGRDMIPTQVLEPGLRALGFVSEAETAQVLKDFSENKRG